MAQTNEKPDKTHVKLNKELNRLKTDLNNEGNMDTDLTKRQLKSRMLVVFTPRVLSPSQMTAVDTANPHSNTPQVEQDPSSPRFNSSEKKVLTKTLKVTGLELLKMARLIETKPPFKYIKTHKHQLETKKNNFKG